MVNDSKIEDCGVDLQSSSSEGSTGQVLQEFHLFPKLPLELRQQIFRTAARVPKLAHTSSSVMNPLLHVNSESRKIIQEENVNITNMYFHPARDILYKQYPVCFHSWMPEVIRNPKLHRILFLISCDNTWSSRELLLEEGENIKEQEKLYGSESAKLNLNTPGNMAIAAKLPPTIGRDLCARLITRLAVPLHPEHHSIPGAAGLFDDFELAKTLFPCLHELIFVHPLLDSRDTIDDLVVVPFPPVPRFLVWIDETLVSTMGHMHRRRQDLLHKGKSEDEVPKLVFMVKKVCLE
ncbi:hypothetical protein GLAREA_06686 [Glarea lozoyensis ATCC 20868]|uniref:2EXR domain-containing protein n=1 Tax=Glarea lozoyensis (strain ATCC 20868 / MF5171) TaxID=1116229 RepID=S3E5L3_GLAL2|nr:uncharacterized protein GLAREA_06686 [Glarea lozoyensis ATCC 20868]EPE33673.1 hypothetical protein GLAREA_06686 [Glarea lozoyensis ATCC 20868]